MVEKTLKSKILNYYARKEDKLFAGSIIDKINKFEMNNYLVHTNFLDINQKEISVNILNKFNIRYSIFKPLEDISRVVIFLIPEYLESENVEEIFGKYISVVKIVPKTKEVITHREYMGTIYSLGLKEDMIGDIFVQDDFAYLVIFKKNVEFLINNLFKVSKSDVKLFELDVYSDEVRNIKVKYKNINVVVASNRIDVILSEIYSLSRSETKSKIQNGDLFINSKRMYFAPYSVEEKDIVSFSKCGKFTVGKVLGTTKSGKIVLNIKKYS